MTAVLKMLPLSLLAAGLAVAPAWAAETRFANWGQIAAAMETTLNQAYQVYLRAENEAAKNLVSEAYFKYYEKEGFERTVMSYISGKRGATVEYRFAVIQQMMGEGRPPKEVRASLDELISWLREDARQLDGGGVDDSPLAVFLQALTIVLREGFEAILVIAAIAAYLNRSGLKRQVRVVYGSGLAAVGVSFLAAIAFQRLFGLSGADQEILEGLTMLLAAVVLFWVSNWMFAKAQAEAWRQYIEGQVQAAVAAGSSFGLAAAAFLAVFREGAETILFYQALIVNAPGQSAMIWAGLGTGGAALAVIFFIVQKGARRLPIKPFFLGASLLMYVMAIAFMGGGVMELQAGGLVGVTALEFIPTVTLLGLYPTLETLIPQAALLALAVFSTFHLRRRARRR